MAHGVEEDEHAGVSAVETRRPALTGSELRWEGAGKECPGPRPHGQERGTQGGGKAKPRRGEGESRVDASNQAPRAEPGSHIAAPDPGPPCPQLADVKHTCFD